MTTQRPWLPWVVWSFAVLAYVVAIVNRSSLSALGLDAQQHFGIDATVLSVFMVIQLLVYALCQVPVGILLDRFGASTLIVSGALLMSIGQALMATADVLWLAILARVLVGAGDACTFISVIRMLGEWFSLRLLPIVSQATGLLGQAGQIISVVPLSLAVGAFGWMSGFLGLASVGILVGILAAIVVRDFPGHGSVFQRFTQRGTVSRRPDQSRLDVTSLLTDSIPVVTSAIPLPPAARPGVFTTLLSLLRVPGVRLAYWVHFSTPFAIHVFMLLWGTPFLVSGMGLSVDASAAMLTLCIVASMIAGSLLGPVTARFAEHRMWVIVITTSMLLVSWSVVLLMPGEVPLWMLIVLVCVIGVGGPTSMIAFEVLRTHAPVRQLGIATGLVNSGGFTAALLVIFGIGFVLDLQGAGTPETYTPGAFRVAMAVQIPFFILGLTMMFIEWRKAKRALLHRQGSLGL